MHITTYLHFNFNLNAKKNSINQKLVLKLTSTCKYTKNKCEILIFDAAQTKLKKTRWASMYIPNWQELEVLLNSENCKHGKQRYWYLQGAELPAPITCNTWLVTQSVIPCSMIIPLAIAKPVITEQIKKNTKKTSVLLGDAYATLGTSEIMIRRTQSS